MIPVEPLEVRDAEEQWAAWEARCRVSHAGHFTSFRNERASFHRLTKPLPALRVALATSGGAYVDGMTPFDLASDAGDDSIRWIPGDVNTKNLRFAHDHYDHTDPDRDPNCIFPLDRLRELIAGGVIGSGASRHLGFMGWIPDPGRLVRERLPQIVSRFLEDRVDAVVLSPG